MSEVMSFWTVNTFSVLVSLAKHRLSRAPPDLPDPSRLHDQTTPLPHGSPRCARRHNRYHSPTLRGGGVERHPPGGKLVGPRDGGG